MANSAKESEVKEYTYGSMSSKFSVMAENKFVAYAAMMLHYGASNHLIVVYSPEECKNDSWASLDGKVSKRIDEVYGGDGSFDKFFEENEDAIVAAFNTRKRLL